MGEFLSCLVGRGVKCGRPPGTWSPKRRIRRLYFFGRLAITGTGATSERRGPGNPPEPPVSSDSNGVNVAEGLLELLQAVAAGAVTPEAAITRLGDLPFADLGFARLDTLREARTGVPEVIFGERKRSEDVVEIAQRLVANHGRVLVTRTPEDTLTSLRAWRPDLRWVPSARVAIIDDRRERPAPVGRILVVAAGTTDLPVADEAAETAVFCGSAVGRLNDVGIAGLHRLLAALPHLRAAEVIIAVAGMDGALPGVIAGLVDRPVIAVPTSVGYGVAAGGIAALGTMLASCAPGMAVVNIDNGFGAGIMAHRINVRVAGGEASG